MSTSTTCSAIRFLSLGAVLALCLVALPGHAADPEPKQEAATTVTGSPMTPLVVRRVPRLGP